MTALREIKLLRELRGPYIVQLLDVFAHKRKNLQLVRAHLDLVMAPHSAGRASSRKRQSTI